MSKTLVTVTITVKQDGTVDSHLHVEDGISFNDAVAALAIADEAMGRMQEEVKQCPHSLKNFGV